jgi:hypothetical protein
VLEDNMEIKSVKLLHSGSGDWVGIYVNDKLVDEGHSIGSDMIKIFMRKIMPEIKYKDEYSADEYLERYGNRCPDTWPTDL